MNEEQNTIERDVKKDRAEKAIKRKFRKKIYWTFSILIFLGVISVIGVWYSHQKPNELPGQSIPEQSRQHITTTNHPAYNSNPPTSGWHFPQPAEWGAYKEEIPDETLLHNMEHGGVWISYKPNISEELKKKLEAFYEKWGRKIIVTPRSQNDADIALAAWTHLDKFSVGEYSEERIDNFIKAFRNRGPEYVP